jgi:uncharacterized protein (UPF0332 family)
MIDPHFHGIAIKLVDKLLIDKGIGVKEREMVYRTSINRLYYSVFHNLALHFHFRFTSVEEKMIHSAIQNKLKMRNLDAIASVLEEMRLSRVDADYHLIKSVKRTDFEEMLEYHQTIIERLECDDVK